ncbi:hypothetical protein F4810DRAFT_155425 [Camillea tinctor]|nr:hypothetical protein F4810DRAFT_155425 [Camillea tinctor]
MLADPSISVLGPDPAHRKCALNGYAFQQDAIQSCNGWQYSCFYSPLAGAGAEPEPLYVHLSRRKLPHGSWETLVFDDYPQTTDDGHNTVQLGVCPGDGTIHLSYDHHCDQIHYRHSIPNLASDPPSFPWTPSLFTRTLPHLPGLESLSSTLLSYITYPRFVPLPSTGGLLFSFRTGKAGLGDDHLASYSPETHAYSLVGPVFIRGISCNPYVHGLDARGGRLHASWVWRGFVEYAGWDDPDDTQHKQQAGPNGAGNNHDICYAWSDDGGRTWRAGGEEGGEPIADLPAGTPIAKGAKGITAFDIPKGSGLTNQEAQAVDGQGGVHVLNRDCVGGEQRWKHYYRAPGGQWTSRALPLVDGSLGGKRGQLAISRGASDLYLLLPDRSSDTLWIQRATRAQGYADYALVWKGSGFPPTEPLVDRTRLEYDGVLSVYTRAYAGGQKKQEEGGEGEGEGEKKRKIDVVVLDFKLEE